MASGILWPSQKGEDVIQIYTCARKNLLIPNSIKSPYSILHVFQKSLTKVRGNDSPVWNFCPRIPGNGDISFSQATGWLVIYKWKSLAVPERNLSLRIQMTTDFLRALLLNCAARPHRDLPGPSVLAWAAANERAVPSSLNLNQLWMKLRQKSFPICSMELRTQGQGVSVCADTVALFGPCVCIGKFGLGGDPLGDFTRLGAPGSFKRRTMV